MTISFNIPDTVKDRVIDGICGQYEYDKYLSETSDSPVLTKAQFSKKKIINFIKSTVIAYERKLAEENKEQQITDAANLVQKDVEDKVNIT